MQLLELFQQVAAAAVQQIQLLHPLLLDLVVPES
jgi:hypothetical protein